MKGNFVRLSMLLAALIAALAIIGCESRSPMEAASQADPIDAIEFAALKHAMTSHAESGKERESYAYYVIERPDYIDRLNGFSPAIAVNDEERFGRIGGVYRELATGKNAKLWRIHNHTIKGEVAEVWITWYSASLAGGGLGVKLERIDGKWIATAIVNGPVS